MKKGEIWYVEIPKINGHEQAGLRPVVILSESEANTILVIPFTSKLQSLKYPSTIEVSPSKTNGLKTTSVALVFQIRAIDRKRLKNKVGILEENKFSEINRILLEKLKI